MEWEEPWWQVRSSSDGPLSGEGSTSGSGVAITKSGTGDGHAASAHGESGSGGGVLLGQPYTLLVGECRGRLLSQVGGNDAILCLTYTGDDARRMEERSDRDARAEVLRLLRLVFGEWLPEARSVRVTRWGKDPFFCGSYSLLPPGSLPNGFAALQRPVADGRLWFGGEACHERYSGYLQGAFLSGSETADRMADALCPTTPVA